MTNNKDETDQKKTILEFMETVFKESDIKLKKEQEKELDEVARDIIESYEIPWPILLKFFQTWEESGTAKEELYVESFANTWLEVFKTNRPDSNEIVNHPVFIEDVLPRLKKIGVEIFQVRNTSLCASTIIPPIACDQCYLSPVCKVKKSE